MLPAKAPTKQGTASSSRRKSTSVIMMHTLPTNCMRTCGAVSSAVYGLRHKATQPNFTRHLHTAQCSCCDVTCSAFEFSAAASNMHVSPDKKKIRAAATGWHCTVPKGLQLLTQMTEPYYCTLSSIARYRCLGGKESCCCLPGTMQFTAAAHYCCCCCC